jgi:hypothetical protein
LPGFTVTKYRWKTTEKKKGRWRSTNLKKKKIVRGGRNRKVPPLAPQQKREGGTEKRPLTHNLI